MLRRRRRQPLAVTRGRAEGQPTRAAAGAAMHAGSCSRRPRAGGGRRCQRRPSGGRGPEQLPAAPRPSAARAKPALTAFLVSLPPPLPRPSKRQGVEPEACGLALPAGCLRGKCRCRRTRTRGTCPSRDRQRTRKHSYPQLRNISGADNDFILSPA